MNSVPAYPGIHLQTQPCNGSKHRPLRSTRGGPSHVGIIGAGLAGLRCADALLQKGVRVTILEARDRIGGRICQGDIGGASVDLGPNWIHGTANNPIVNISKQTSTVTRSWESPQTVIDSSGQPLDAVTTARLSDFMWTTIDKALEYSQNHAATIPPDLSLFDYFREEVEKTAFTQPEKEACLELSKLWGSYIANLFVASTYKNILHSVAKPALQGAEVHLSDPVVSVEAALRKPDAAHHVTVHTASGQRYMFDEVVATFPLGWLKQNKSAFSPALPARLSKAIDNISYGHLEKIYVRFPDAFWHTESRECQRNSDNGADEADRSTSVPVFTQFLNPTYTDHPPTPFWNQECVSLAALPESCAHPTLLFYLYGSCASQIVHQLSSIPPTSKEYHEILNDFLHPFYSRMPGYSPASASCKPVGFLATKWQLDPWSGNGSYSNFQVGLEEGDRDIEIMREGIGIERGVWFAGEHTAPFVALGTTLGAYWSGELIAEKVYEMLSGKEGQKQGEL
ncbi:conserved hypothetical protein [Uncinocarpus reesii 1704]|uniref:Amine oxidase domain-containing protein n=1 Tax=Uncinocarpus reesii (strain UAMH 1704) TaxID=336963 RepID=C4JPV2_UNCRE|nr:uncharacterized protein UREG_04595 [Uncinocarpus reesii 1704]EEP79749.1 conserved hypothetical protein [Uncinocarpus reesii 1704]